MKLIQILKKSLKALLILIIFLIIGYNLLWFANYQNVKHFAGSKGQTQSVESMGFGYEIRKESYGFDIILPEYPSLSWGYMAYSHNSNYSKVFKISCYPSNSIIKQKNHEYEIELNLPLSEEDDSTTEEYLMYIYRVNSDLDILEVSEESKKGQGKKVFEDSLDELKKLKDEAIKMYGEEYYK